MIINFDFSIFSDSDVIDSMTWCLEVKLRGGVCEVVVSTLHY